MKQTFSTKLQSLNKCANTHTNREKEREREGGGGGGGLGGGGALSHTKIEPANTYSYAKQRTRSTPCIFVKGWTVRTIVLTRHAPRGFCKP